MAKGLFFRLAFRNLRSSRQTTLPFLLAASLMTFVLMSLMMLAGDPGILSLKSGRSVQMLLQFGVVVIGLFQAAILFYANSFLIRRRRHELGLYGVLGLEKRHIAVVLVLEMLGIYLLTLLAGGLLTAALGNGVFALIQSILGIAVPVSGHMTWSVVFQGATVLGGLFLLLTGYNLISLQLANPIALLKSNQTAEKMPKGNWLWALISLGLLGSGYAIALSPGTGSAAVRQFFLAVLLVISGTFLLFQAGAVWLLQLMKRCKTLYYRTVPFISISGLMYRLKQNAAGLASVCILCTTTMVTIGGSVSIYLGSEASLRTVYPTEFSLQAVSEAGLTQAAQAVNQVDAAFGLSAVRQQMRYWQLFGSLTGDQLTPMQQDQPEGWFSGKIFLKEAYEQLQGAPLQLAPGEIGWAGDHPPASLRVRGVSHPVVPVPMPAFVLPSDLTVNVIQAILVVDHAELASAMALDMWPEKRPQEGQAAGAADAVDAGTYALLWDTHLPDGMRAQYQAQLIRLLQEKGTDDLLRSRDHGREEWVSINGGFLLIGLFLSFVFMLGTALIMYFKQLSEGYQDHQRFQILQKVGMSHQEVKKTIQQQTMLLFLLPLLVAVIHVLGAMPILVVILGQIGVVNAAYILWTTLGAAVLVGLVYAAFYHLTTRTYLKLVRF